MKNVKVILISVALCATVFANSRIDALGGEPGFWAGDRANVADFPATINDHQFLELDGVGGTNGADATLLWGDATKWGFNFDTTDNDTWMNIMWGNGDIGLSVQYMTTDWTTGAGNFVSDPLLSNAANELTGFAVGYGQNFDWGELGVHFNSVEDASSYGVNWRSDMSAWVFDSAKASFEMNDNGGGMTSLDLSFDLFTHLDAGAADILFALGVEYASEDNDSSVDLNGDVVAATSRTSMTLPSATIAVESALNDWATLRAFVSHSYLFSCSNDTGSGCNDDAAGPGTTDYGFGLGFNWGSASLDMSIGEALFTNPVSNITGFDNDAFTDTEVTLSYTF